MKKNDSVLTTDEAAKLLCAHIESTRRLARRGKIPAYKIGKDWRYRREVLLQWADTHHVRRKKPCVLVVDDEESIRTLISRFLEPNGFRVLLAKGGETGLALVNSETIDIVLLDLKMPEMNGPEFIGSMRDSGKRIPIIVITGYPDSDLIQQAMRNGPITLLAKPVNLDSLLEAINNALNIKSERSVNDLCESCLRNQGAKQVGD
jgi:excisionase family DNA binding protein